MPTNFFSGAERVLVLHAGGLGDLVLSTPTLGALTSALAGRHVTFCCRSEFAGLAALWPFAFDRIIGIDVDPYTTSPLDVLDGLHPDPLLAQIAEDAPDTLVSLELAPTWVTPVAAAMIRPQRSLARNFVTLAPSRLAALLERLELEPFAYETYEADEARPEATRYETIRERLDLPAEDVRVALGLDAERRAEVWFRDRDDFEGERIACFPFANRLVPTKRWPEERHLDAIATFSARHAYEPVIFGDVTEWDDLNRFATGLRERGRCPVIFAGEPDSLELAAAVLARCSLFLGNDTGLAHLAAALGVSGVTVYGGGTWPRFEPWAPGTIGIVHPLPCFGCGWDCAFEKPLCVEAVDVADALDALELARAGTPVATVVALERRSTVELETIASAASVHRHAQEDRANRYDVIVSLQERLRQAERLARLRLDLVLDTERERSRAEEEIARLNREIAKNA